QAGSLPLLQYTLDLLWQNEDLSDRTLNIATYHQLGGVSGALQKRVNEIYQGLPAEQQLATKQILLRLVDVVALEQSEVLRTAVSKRAYKSEFTDTQAETVQLLINKSLLVSDDLNQEGSTVEIAHEALLNSWAELKAWINDARTTISLNNRLAEDASRWQELKYQNLSQADDELWSGSKLEQVIELREDGTFAVVLGGLSQLADKFIEQSIAKRDRKIQQEVENAQRLAQAERKARIEAEKRVTEQKKANQKLRIWSLIAVAFGVTASLLGISSYISSQESQLQAQAANIKVKLSLSNQLDRLLESIQLVGQNQTFNQRWFKPKSQLLPDVQSVLYQSVEENREQYSFNDHQAEVTSVAISSDGQYLVSGSSDNTVKLWDVKDKSVIHTFEGHQAEVTSVAISRDGRYLVSGSGDSTVKLWDIKSQSLIQTFEGHQAWVSSVAISSDGQYLVSGSYDTTVKLWDIKNQSLIYTFEGHQAWVNSVAISNDGQYLVSGSGNISGSDDNTVKLWDIKKQSLIYTFEGHQTLVNAVAISRDGRYLVSGSGDIFESRDNTLKLWDIKKQSLKHTFEGHQTLVNAVAISRDGRYLVSGSYDNTVKLWDIKNQSLIHSFEGHQALVRAVAISSDGQYLVSGGNDNTVKLWDIKSQSLIHTFEGHQDWVNSVAISSDGSSLVSGSSDNTVKLWRGINWQNWLSIGCERIRSHPVLASVEVNSAAATCLEYGGWTEQEQAELLVKQGLAFAAEKADYKEARDKFEQAQKLKSDIDLNPNTEAVENNPNTVASQLAALSKIQQGVNLAREGKVPEALSSFSEAQKLYPNLKIESQSWDNLCWFGSIYGQAPKVLFACENAVELAPDAESQVVYLDGRGLARALMGDTQGAIKDFQVYVDSPEFHQESRNKRKQWIESLSIGQNPFTDDVLEELKKE
ncbi:MAG: hypothetical protein AAFW67_09235, partial [Cyanobacteria bacterium J06638_38]